jgi:hypothetical protein
MPLRALHKLKEIGEKLEHSRRHNRDADICIGVISGHILSWVECKKFRQQT